jgi:hypothetical protein
MKDVVLDDLIKEDKDKQKQKGKGRANVLKILIVRLETSEEEEESLSKEDQEMIDLIQDHKAEAQITIEES